MNAGKCTRYLSEGHPWGKDVRFAMHIFLRKLYKCHQMTSSKPSVTFPNIIDRQNTKRLVSFFTTYHLLACAVSCCLSNIPYMVDGRDKSYISQ